MHLLIEAGIDSFKVEGRMKSPYYVATVANAYRRSRRMYADGLRFPYPHEYFWQQAAAADIRVIVGSDCHAPEQVCDDHVRLAHEQVQRLHLHEMETIF